jgi:site-specific recombinase XerD
MEIKQDLVKQYFTYRTQANGMAISTAKAREPHLRKFLKETNKEVKKITESDILNYLNKYKLSTRNTQLSLLRNFFRFAYVLDKDDKLPPCVKRIEFISNRQQQRNGELFKKRERIVTPDEYNTLLKTCSEIKHKAIIETLYLYGVRISELLSMRSNGVKQENGLTIITVYESKTKAREIPISENPQYLMEWYNTYQLYKGQQNKPLWISTYGSNLNNAMKPGSINRLLERLIKRAKLTKHISPHDFRHTVITRDLAKGMPNSLIEEKHGLVKGTRQFAVYDHNTTKDLITYLTKQPLDNPETYNAIKQQNETLLDEHQKEILYLKEELKNLKTLILINSHEKDESLLIDEDGKEHVKFQETIIDVSELDWKTQKKELKSK